jgi:hypothetical protein
MATMAVLHGLATRRFTVMPLRVERRPWHIIGAFPKPAALTLSLPFVLPPTSTSGAASSMPMSCHPY